MKPEIFNIMPQDYLRLEAPGLSLDQTLPSGHTFCWQSIDGGWKGYISGKPCRIYQSGNHLIVHGDLTPSEAAHYFALDVPWDKLLAALPDEPHLQQALQSLPGLRCVREPWFECTANFICSSLKQIPHIRQINLELRRRFGQSIGSDAFSFPEPEVIAALEEKDLRACRLGFRARHLLAASRQIADGRFNWAQAMSLSTDEAALYLQNLQGVGEKVAHCILLYAGGRYDAFPVDVWVFRLMRQFYFPKSRRPPKLKNINRKSRELFGPLRGIAQHYLFHWYRTTYVKD
ncbi:MAG: DNA glycosylase [Methylacidiphilales bacterium]|nr:DNA glycosylase [Candidatus Methylacidiphilales bacterium]